MFAYEINGFAVGSEFALPAEPCEPGAGGAPLSVRRCAGDLDAFGKAQLINQRGDFLRAYDVRTGVLVCASERLRMLVPVDGSAMLFDFEDGHAEDEQLACALATNLGTALCTLLRGDVPLHGAGVELDGRYIGVLAPSGAGKSTLLWALLDAGARYGNDDVIPLRFENGICAVPAGGLHAKLSLDALRRRGLCPDDYAAWLPGTDEFWVPVSQRERATKPQLLEALFVLQPYPAEAGEQVQIATLQGGAAFSALLDHVQGLWAGTPLLNGPCLAARLLEVARVVPLHVLRYPRSREVLPVLVSTLRSLTQLAA